MASQIGRAGPRVSSALGHLRRRRRARRYRGPPSSTVAPWVEAVAHHRALEASIGALPLNRAKCPELGNRHTPVWPTTMAATSGLTPCTSVTVVPDAATASAGRDAGTSYRTACTCRCRAPGGWA